MLLTPIIKSNNLLHHIAHITRLSIKYFGQHWTARELSLFFNQKKKSDGWIIPVDSEPNIIIIIKRVKKKLEIKKENWKSRSIEWELDDDPTRSLGSALTVAGSTF